MNALPNNAEQSELEHIRDAVRKHRDAKGHDQCWLLDQLRRCREYADGQYKQVVGRLQDTRK